MTPAPPDSPPQADLHTPGSPAAIAAAIREACKAQKRSPNDVLEAAGLPGNFLQEARRSRFPISAGQLVLVGKTLGVKPAQLMIRARTVQAEWDQLAQSNETEAGPPDLPQLAVALNDPATCQLLTTAATLEEFAPTDLADLLGRQVSPVAARLRQLRAARIVTLVDCVAGARGSVTHVYRVVDAVRELVATIVKYRLCDSASEAKP